MAKESFTGEFEDPKEEFSKREKDVEEFFGKKERIVKVDGKEEKQRFIEIGGKIIDLTGAEKRFLEICEGTGAAVGAGVVLAPWFYLREKYNLHFDAAAYGLESIPMAGLAGVTGAAGYKAGQFAGEKIIENKRNMQKAWKKFKAKKEEGVGV